MTQLIAYRRKDPSSKGNAPAPAVTYPERARLEIPSLSATLELPWWPSEVEYSGLAADYVETPRPGRSPLVTRSGEQSEKLRIAFTLRENDVNVSVRGYVEALRVIARAKPLAQLMLGVQNRGLWHITEAGYVETDWAANGEPSVVDVILQLIYPGDDAGIVVGPIRPKRRATR